MRILNLIFLALLGVSACGQVSFEIKYKITTKLDGGIPLPREAKLQYTNQKSLFTYDIGKGAVCIDRDGNVGDLNLSYNTVNEINHGPVIMCYFMDEEGNRIYVDHSKNTMQVREIVMMLPFVYSEQGMPKMKWTIGKESKKIGKFQCKKASTSFRGREYTAWYTQELPAKIGPWKFNGLPGTILEVVDKTEEFSLNFIAYKTSKEQMIDKINNWQGDYITFEKFKTIYDETQKKLLNKYSSQAGRNSKSGIRKLNKIEEIF